MILRDLGCQKRELSILLLDDAGIRALNRDYLQRDRPTDVIAFPQGEDVVPPAVLSLLGDVVISLETAQRQALQSGKQLQEEFACLLIHGILHLLGYDHVGPAVNRRHMRTREDELLHLCKNHHLC